MALSWPWFLLVGFLLPWVAEKKSVSCTTHPSCTDIWLPLWRKQIKVAPTKEGWSMGEGFLPWLTSHLHTLLFILTPSTDPAGTICLLLMGRRSEAQDRQVKAPWVVVSKSPPLFPASLHLQAALTHALCLSVGKTKGRHGAFTLFLLRIVHWHVFFFFVFFFPNGTTRTYSQDTLMSFSKDQTLESPSRPHH